MNIKILELATIQRHKCFRMKKPLIVVISLHCYLVSVINYSFCNYINVELCLMDVSHFLYIYKFSKLKILTQNSRSKNVIRKAATLHDFVASYDCYFSSPVSKECIGCFYKCLCLCVTYLLVLSVEKWFDYFIPVVYIFKTMKTYHWP